LSRDVDRESMSRDALSRVVDRKPMSRGCLSRVVDRESMSRDALSRDVDRKPMSRDALSRVVDRKPMSRDALSRVVDREPMSRDAHKKSHTHKITHKKTRHPDAWSPLKYSSDMLGSVNCDRFVCEYFPGVVLQFLRDLLTQPPVDGFECFPEHERPHFCMVRVTCDDMDQPVFYHLERRFLQFFAEVSRNGSGGHLGECAFIHQLV